MYSRTEDDDHRSRALPIPLYFCCFDSSRLLFIQKLWYGIVPRSYHTVRHVSLPIILKIVFSGEREARHPAHHRFWGVGIKIVGLAQYVPTIQKILKRSNSVKKKTSFIILPHHNITFRYY